MKALVLAGGSGTRLRPLSHTMPKQLIPLAGRPVLEYALENIRDAGVREVGIVVGDWAREIAATIGDGSRLGLRVTYIRQERPLGLAHCVSLARPFLGGDDFLMYLGDVVLEGGVVRACERFRRDRPAAQLVVARVADPRSFGVVQADPEGTVLAMVEKPREPVGDLVATGVYFFTPAVHRAIASIGPSARGELEITDAVRWLLEHGERVRAVNHEGYWKDTGRAEDVLACNRRMLDGLVRRVEGRVDPGSELVGAVVVGPGARVVGSRVEGPTILGAGTVVENSRIGPHTSVGRECAVRSSEVSDSIVLDGAVIDSVTGLRGSLIGRGASVSPNRAGDAGHRMVVGDHVRIEIAA